MRNRKPVSLRRRLVLAVVNSVLLTAPVAIAMHMPVTTTYATPDHDDAASEQAEKAQRRYDRAMAKCADLPSGVLPGAAVVGWADGSVSYTEDPVGVDVAFNIALGEVTDPAVVGVTLCR